MSIAAPNSLANTFISAQSLYRSGRPNPAGVDLGDTAEMLNLQSLYDKAAVTGDDGKAPAVDWEGIESAANDMLQRSVDMRVLIVLAAAVLRTRGLDAFADVLRAIDELVNDRWLQWFPRSADPGEGDAVDADWRGNVLSDLRDKRIVDGLRELRPFAQTRLGALSVANLNIDRDGKAPDIPSISAALAAQPSLNPLVVRAQKQLADCGAAVEHVVSALSGQWSVYIDLSKLTAICDGAAATLQRVMSGQSTQANAAALSEPVSSSDVKSETPSGGAVMSATAVNDNTSLSRESARDVLQQLIDFFHRTEPSSPIPLYLQRAQKLIGLEFKDVVKQMGGDVQTFTQD